MKKTYDYFMLVLSLYVIVILAIDVITDWSDTTAMVFERIDLGICVIFLVDWFYFLLKAENKKKYCFVRFFDLVSSIPFAQFLRPFRVFRVVRLLRAFRLFQGIKGVARVLQYIATHQMRSALLIYLGCTGVILFYCTLGLYHFENGVNGKINGYGDVIWMALTTLSTVAYGDITPMTTGGRVLVLVLAVTGVGFFALVTAEIVAWSMKYVKKQGQ
jgi:voltage-gated potassium channel